MLIGLIIIAVISTASYAATVSTTEVSYQAQYGLSYDVTGAFTATDKGFRTTASNRAASALPAAWNNGGTVNTALVKGRWQYSVDLTLQTSPAVATTYTVRVYWDQGSGITQMGQLTVNVPGGTPVGQTMTFVFDTGSASFSTPLAVDVIVA